MKSNREIILQNEDMADGVGDLEAGEYDPRTRQWVYPPPPDEVEKDPYAF